MSEVKAAKDALVASLFELSKAAQDAAGATANLYKASNADVEAPMTSLNNLAKTINALVSSVDNNGPGGMEIKSEAVKAEKKKKPERDPNAPKKPLTMYFAYLFHVRDSLRNERRAKGLPPLSAIEMNDYVKERWNKLPADEKAKWQKRYQDQLKEYNKQKELYQAKLAGKPVELPPQPKLANLEDSDDDSSSSSSEEEEVHKKEKKEKKRKSEKSDKEKKKKKKSH